MGSEPAMETTIERKGILRAAVSRHSPLHILLAFAVCSLVLPVLLILFLASFKPRASLPFDKVPLTLLNYVEVFSDSFTYEVALNTLLYAGCSLLIGFAIVVPIVWLVERTDIPFKNLISIAMFIPLVIPGMLTSFGWVLLLSPRTGFVNLLLRSLMGIEEIGPLNIYTFWGLVILTGVGIVPGMFVMLSGLFRNMDPELEDAGATAGGSSGNVLFRITLPLMAPGLVSVGIYYTIILIEMFEIPLVIGLNAKFPVLSTYIFTMVFSDYTTPLYGLAGTIGSVAVILGAILASFYEKFTRSTYRFATITGRRSRRRLLHLGSWKYLGLFFVLFYMLVKIVLPFLALLWTSLFLRWTLPSIEALRTMTLGVYRLILEDPVLLQAGRNSLTLVLAAGTGTMMLATLVSWIVVRSQKRWVRWLDAVAFLPRAIPGVVIALAVLLLLIRTPAYGTIWILVIGHMINFLPFGVRIMNASLMQIHVELEEASQVSGAGSLRTLRWILFPLSRPALWNGWLWVVAHSVRDFTFPLMLGTSASLVIAQLLWQYWQLGLVERVSAMSVMLIGILVLLVSPAHYYIHQHRGL